jgi:hypothetical protein
MFPPLANGAVTGVVPVAAIAYRLKVELARNEFAGTISIDVIDATSAQSPEVSCV